MKVLVEQKGPVTVLRPQGDVKVGGGELALREAVAAQVAGGATRLLIDLAAVGFMDSSGLGELVRTLRAVRQAGGQLRLSRAGERVVETLKITRLTRVLELHDSEDQALAAFS